MLPAPVSTFPTRKPASPASMGSRSPNGNHPFATGYQAFDMCFRRRVYRATAWGLSAGALPGWRDLHPSAYGHAAGEVVRARAITAMVLRSRLQNHVEGRLRRAPDALEAARPDYLANPCLAGLRRAPHRPAATARSARRPSSNPAELKSAARVQIVFEAVACHRLDDHPRAVRL